MGQTQAFGGGGGPTRKRSEEKLAEPRTRGRDEQHTWKRQARTILGSSHFSCDPVLAGSSALVGLLDRMAKREWTQESRPFPEFKGTEQTGSG